jgi:endoglucanase
MAAAQRVGLGIVITVLVIIIGGFTAVALFAAFGAPGSAGPGEAPIDNPLNGRALYVDPDSSAANADREGETAEFALLADTPAAIWLLPEENEADTIGPFVQSIVAAAAAVDEVPVFVVYGIPDRDCGNQSAGGTDDYPAWIAALATGLSGGDSVLILEPDALSLSVQCGNVDERTAQISGAIDVLAPTGSIIYLDAGHSNWNAPDLSAQLLTAAGIDRVRGFATNVSNFNTTADEIAYADRVSALTNGAHYVIDTSRNGNGSNGEWCNPSGRAVGDPPSVVTDGTELDALLWIKTAGESDGTCNGGPKAGEWWPEMARQLIAGR